MLIDLWRGRSRKDKTSRGFYQAIEHGLIMDDAPFPGDRNDEQIKPSDLRMLERIRALLERPVLNAVEHQGKAFVLRHVRAVFGERAAQGYLG